MEKQLLSDAKLKPVYSKAVWLYVFRDFNEKEADRAAERISLRFGLTSWPQHILVDPNNLKVIGNTGRSLKTFLPAVDRAAGRVKSSESIKRAVEIDQADQRAIELEKNRDPKLARQRLEDTDIVVRFRALDILAEKDAKFISDQAQQLLRVPNDPFRYKVCEVLAETGDSKAIDALEQLVKKPTKTRNPNVLRINAVKALSACGDADSVTVIGPFASSGEYLNGLTGISVSALLDIVKRHPSAKSAVVSILTKSFPKPPTDSNAIRKRYCTSLAKRVHKALAQVTTKKISFPTDYDAKTSAQLVESWKTIATKPSSGK